ncbi:MAG: phosphatidylserine decarboxylase family protein [Bacteroidales bacterium]
MTLHKEGKKSLLLSWGIFITLLVILAIYPCPIIGVLAFLAFIPAAFFLQFFRLPKRNITPIASQLLSPCDGKVVIVGKKFEKEYFNKEMSYVAIFMNVDNVHVNMVPIDGEIIYKKHNKGKFIAAFKPKSADENENATTIIKTTDGKEILVRQIAGAAARRISTYPEVGDTVTQKEELGFIKLGSRVDLYLPEGSKILVKEEQKVRWAKDIIAKL